MPNVSESNGKILFPDLSFRVINAFFEVYNAHGYGFLEAVYSRSMVHALEKRGIEVAREVPIDVFFDGHLVGHHRLDLLVDRRIVLEIKATEQLSQAAQRQTRSYLAAANLELGIILHFGPVATFQRVLAKKR
jgi:GxxExxY protein